MAMPATLPASSPPSMPLLSPGAFLAFVDDADTRSRVEAEVPLLSAGAPVHVIAAASAAALEVAEWPVGLRGLVIDIADSRSPVADMAALLGALPQDCVVVAVGDANDVSLYRDLSAAGVADYLMRPLAEGVLHKALDRALAAKAREIELRNAQAALQAVGSAAAAEDVAPLVVACAGTRGGVGATTTAIALASMLAEGRHRESLILDLDLHYGSVMLALDLDATDALLEALAAPDRVDAMFVDQSIQRKSELLCALGAEEPPQAAAMERIEATAISRLVAQCQRRFRQIVIDVPRGNPLMQRQALEVATDLVLVCDLTLAGARDAMRLMTLARDVAPQLRIHVVASGVGDPRRAPIKPADLERSIKQKIACQVASDDKSAAAAINAGKPLNEAFPRSAAVRSLQPLVNTMLAAVGGGAPARSGPFWAKMLKPKAKPAAAGAGA